VGARHGWLRLGRHRRPQRRRGTEWREGKILDWVWVEK
jgi:hypothetical protein